MVLWGQREDRHSGTVQMLLPSWKGREPGVGSDTGLSGGQGDGACVPDPNLPLPAMWSPAGRDSPLPRRLLSVTRGHRTKHLLRSFVTWILHVWNLTCNSTNIYWVSTMCWHCTRCEGTTSQINNKTGPPRGIQTWNDQNTEMLPIHTETSNIHDAQHSNYAVLCILTEVDK